MARLSAVSSIYKTQTAVQEVDRFLLVLLGKVSIPQCHGHRLVAQYLLNILEAGTVHD